MKWSSLALALLLVLLCAPSTASDAHKPAAQTTAFDLDLDAISKIQVGATTGAQIVQLLGKPYRTTNYGDCNPIDYQEHWEYVGRDAAGWYRIHIEFDEAHIARLVAKVPQKGAIQVLASSSDSGAHHDHGSASHEK